MGFLLFFRGMCFVLFLKGFVLAFCSVWGGGFVVYFLFRLCPVVCRILVPQPRIEPTPSAVEAQNLNHWTVREVPVCFFFIPGQEIPCLAMNSICPRMGARTVPFALSLGLSSLLSDSTSEPWTWVLEK